MTFPWGFTHRDRASRSVRRLSGTRHHGRRRVEIEPLEGRALLSSLDVTATAVPLAAETAQSSVVPAVAMSARFPHTGAAGALPMPFAPPQELHGAARIPTAAWRSVMTPPLRILIPPPTPTQIAQNAAITSLFHRYGY